MASLPQYPFKTTPRKHQLSEFESTRDIQGWAYFHEQRTGKSKLALDVAGDLFLRKRISAVILVAPPGVERNWLEGEVPKHLADCVARKSLTYRTGMMKTKKGLKAFKNLLEFEGLIFFAISYPAFITKDGKLAVWKILKNRECLYVLDESIHIKTPASKTSKAIVKSAQYAPFRRALCGTPMDSKPFDLYTQMKFVDPEIWKRIGIPNFHVFKQRYANWGKGFNSKIGKEFPILQGYKNLPELRRIVESLSSRVLRPDDLPPKQFVPRYFDLSKETQKVYDQLKKEFVAYLDNSGDEIDGLNVMTRILRLQQITSGYASITEEDGKSRCVEIPGKNNRLATLMDLVEEQGDAPAVIWAKFIPDIDRISAEFLKRGISHRTFDGRTSSEDRVAFQNGFLNGDFEKLIGNPSVGGKGWDFQIALLSIYYNNSYKLIDRMQSEDRVQSLDKKESSLYIDLVANGTIDEEITANLVGKVDTIEKVMEMPYKYKDGVREWLK